MTEKEHSEIEKAASKAIVEYLRDRILIFGNGTGNLLKIGNRNFIVTCLHVANDFYKNNFKGVVIRDNVRIPVNDLNLIGSTKNYDKNVDEENDLDIAVFEITCDFDARSMYTLDDLEIVDDFKSYDFELKDIIICGLPSAITIRKNEAFHYPHFTFTTIPLKEKNSEKYLYADYPHKSLQKDGFSEKKLSYLNRMD